MKCFLLPDRTLVVLTLAEVVAHRVLALSAYVLIQEPPHDLVRLVEEETFRQVSFSAKGRRDTITAETMIAINTKNQSCPKSGASCLRLSTITLTTASEE
ncbi:MAG: hypothetical protein ACE5KV_06480 [Thermoplasmata archaeon]